MTPTGLDKLIDGLPGFFETLRKQAGFGIEPAQLLMAQGLILNLAAKGQLPDSLGRLGPLIGPIVCASRRQQEDFARRFQAWVATIEPLEQAGQPPKPQADLGRTLHEVGEKGRLAWKRALPLVAALGSTLLVGTICLVVVLRKSDPTPAKASAPELKVARPPDPISGHVSAAAESLGVVIAVIAALGFEVVAGAWLIRRWSRTWWDGQAEMILRRRSASGIPRTTVLKVRPADPWPAKTRQQLSRAAVGLLRRRVVEEGGAQIDVAATLDRLLREAGPPRPVQARRLVTPEYLILVDRITLRDHQADWADALVDRLAADQVSAVRFEFATDPRVCRPRRESRPTWTLRNLAERYADHRLLLFTDGGGLIDPRTGAPAAWTGAFEAWEVRALLTPLPPAGWTSREDGLEAAGFLLEPASAEGLAALATRLSGQETSHQDQVSAWIGKPVPPLPGPLRIEPERWLDPTPPPIEEVERMTRDLRWYLKDDYDWLAACAVYPELRWDLTMELGRVLSAASGRPFDESTGLARLVRLPWFRQGSLPDWLRVWLVRDLAGPREQAVRGALGQLLIGSERVENAGFTTGPTLAIAHAAGDGGTLSALAQGVRRSLARTQAPDGPSNDYVFAGFLENRARDSLDFQLPAGVRALFDAKTAAVSPQSQIRAGKRGLLDVGFYLAYLMYSVIFNVIFVLIVCILGFLLVGKFAESSWSAGWESLWAYLAILLAIWLLQRAANNLPARVAGGRPTTQTRLMFQIIWGGSLIASGMIVHVSYLIDSLLNSGIQTFFYGYIGLWFFASIYLAFLFRGRPLAVAMRLQRGLLVPLFMPAFVKGLYFFFYKIPFDFTSSESVSDSFSSINMVIFLSLLGPELTMAYHRRWKRVDLPEPPALERDSLLGAFLRDPTILFRGDVRPLAAVRAALNDAWNRRRSPTPIPSKQGKKSSDSSKKRAK